MDFVCLLGQPQYDAYREICRSLDSLEFRESTEWEPLAAELNEGAVPAAAVCGLLYRKLHHQGCAYRPVASPLLNGPRYSGGPYYWADVVVRAGSSIERFEDLRAKDWLFNETDSYSGYRSYLSELARRGLGPGFLGDSVATGSHAESWRRLLDGEGDFTVLDSTVYDYLPERQKAGLRVVESIGPKPAPLLICLPGNEDALRPVLELSNLPEPFRGFAPVSHADYDCLWEDWELSQALA